MYPELLSGIRINGSPGISSKVEVRINPKTYEVGISSKIFLK